MVRAVRCARCWWITGGGGCLTALCDCDCGSGCVNGPAAEEFRASFVRSLPSRSTLPAGGLSWAPPGGPAVRFRATTFVRLIDRA